MACNLSALIRRLRCCAEVLPENPFTSQHDKVCLPSSKGTTNTDVMSSDGGVVTLGTLGGQLIAFPLC